MNIWSVYNKAHLINCIDVQNWHDLQYDTNLAIDDFHKLRDEEVFHFYNSLISNNKSILVTVDVNSNFKIKLKDLQSRFKSFTSSIIEDRDVS